MFIYIALRAYDPYLMVASFIGDLQSLQALNFHALMLQLNIFQFTDSAERQKTDMQNPRSFCTDIFDQIEVLYKRERRHNYFVGVINEALEITEYV